MIQTRTLNKKAAPNNPHMKYRLSGLPTIFNSKKRNKKKMTKEVPMKCNGTHRKKQRKITHQTLCILVILLIFCIQYILSNK